MPYSSLYMYGVNSRDTGRAGGVLNAAVLYQTVEEQNLLVHTEYLVFI